MYWHFCEIYAFVLPPADFHRRNSFVIWQTTFYVKFCGKMWFNIPKTVAALGHVISPSNILFQLKVWRKNFHRSLVEEESWVLHAQLQSVCLNHIIQLYCANMHFSNAFCGLFVTFEKQALPERRLQINPHFDEREIVKSSVKSPNDKHSQSAWWSGSIYIFFNYITNCSLHHTQHILKYSSKSVISFFRNDANKLTLPLKNWQS